MQNIAFQHEMNLGRLRRRVIASFGTYAEAERAADYLADENFPVERATIVAEGIKFVEQITGKRTWVRAVSNGALTGGVLGMFLGAFMGLFNIVQPLVSAFALAIYGIVFGLVLGAVISAVAYSFASGRRDFTSVGSMEASLYSLVVDEDMADEARRVLERGEDEGYLNLTGG